MKLTYIVVVGVSVYNGIVGVSKQLINVSQRMMSAGSALMNSLGYVTGTAFQRLDVRVSVVRPQDKFLAMPMAYPIFSGLQLAYTLKENLGPPLLNSDN